MTGLGEPAARTRITLLRHNGFQFGPLPDLQGGVTGLYACRVIPGAVEALLLRNHATAFAVRVPNTFDPGAPFAIPAVMWSRSGMITEVVDALLGLPSPESRRR
jgi:hypothetical protein